MSLSACIAAITLSGEMTLGELLVGLGTLGLGMFTWQLARQTKREVDASAESLELTRESVQLSRESIEALDMPFVIAAPQDGIPMMFAEVEGEWDFSCRFWNLGKGPAIVTDLSIRNGAELLQPLNSQRPVAAAQVHDARISLEPPVPGGLGEEDAAMTLRVYYSHASGARYMTTSRLQVRGNDAYCESYTRSGADDDGREPQPPDGS